MSGPSVSSLSCLGAIRRLGHSLLQCGLESSVGSVRPSCRHLACFSLHIHCPSSQSQSESGGHWCHRQEVLQSLPEKPKKRGELWGKGGKSHHPSAMSERDLGNSLLSIECNFYWASVCHCSTTFPDSASCLRTQHAQSRFGSFNWNMLLFPAISLLITSCSFEGVSPPSNTWSFVIHNEHFLNNELENHIDLTFS